MLPCDSTTREMYMFQNITSKDTSANIYRTREFIDQSYMPSCVVQLLFMYHFLPKSNLQAWLLPLHSVQYSIMLVRGDHCVGD